MTAPAQEKTTAEFDLVIGDLELEIPELDDTVAALTDGHTNPSCARCTCINIYCF
jgi:hypothetical protein